MKYAAAVILYNPEKTDVYKIKEYLKSFDMVYIYDNSLDNSDYYNELDFDSKKVVYNFNGKNDGLPYAYNRVLEYLEDKSFDYLCTLDQDSIYTHEEICKMKKYIENNGEDKIAIYGPAIKYAHENKKELKEEIFKNREWVISSGSFININILKDNNVMYDENYFIDRFEIDLCKQLTNLKYDVGMYYGSVLNQQLGEIAKGGHAEHSVLRNYYLFRNRFYFNKKYYTLPKRLCLNILQTGRHFLSIFLYEKEKSNKMKIFFVAVMDYLKGNMGIKNENFKNI